MTSEYENFSVTPIRFASWIFIGVLVFLVAHNDMQKDSLSRRTDAEVKFSDTSSSGMSIVPASCDSDPHYAGECDPPCLLLNFCSGLQRWQRATSCVETLLETCSYACSADACIPPPPPTGNITVTPDLIRKSATTQVSWSATDVSSCSVTGSNGDTWSVGSGTLTTQTSTTLTRTTEYVLTCPALDGSTFRDTATVTTAPEFRER
ncbi:MAG: hypothetical protein AAB421_04655 [Patescibacteria group bacterium]